MPLVGIRPGSIITILGRVSAQSRPPGIPRGGVALSQTGVNLPAGRQEQEVSRHTAMNSHYEIAAKIEYEVFPTPPHRQNISCSDFSQKIGQFGMANGALPENLCALNSRAHNSCPQLASSVFYFR